MRFTRLYRSSQTASSSKAWLILRFPWLGVLAIRLSSRHIDSSYHSNIYNSNHRGLNVRYINDNGALSDITEGSSLTTLTDEVHEL